MCVNMALGSILGFDGRDHVRIACRCGAQVNFAEHHNKSISECPTV